MRNEKETLASSGTRLPRGARAASSTWPTNPVYMADEHLLDAPAALAALEEDAVFNNWLHRSLSRLDAIVLSLFTLYWVHQTWLSGGHPSEMLVLLLIACLLAFRIFYAAHTQHAEQQSSTERLLRVASAVDGCAHVPLLMSNDAESDGVRWCICLLVAHAVEAGTIALGRTSRVLSIAQPRLDHRELAQAICMLIGLMHGVRPIPRRLKLCTATAFELIFFLWLAPCMPLHPDGHPALLPSGAINVDWIKLVGGCAVFFALGYVVSWQMLAHVVRPLWQTHVAQIERLTAEKDRLSAEKDRLLYDFYLADDRRTRAEGEVVRLQSIGSGDGGSSRESGTPPLPLGTPSHAPSVRSDSFGVGGSSTAGTNAELSELTVRAELLQGEGTGYMAFDGTVDGAHLAPFPLYQLLSEYAGERHRQGICYLTAPAMREPLRARVAPDSSKQCGGGVGGGGGVLVDAAGVLLNPSGALTNEEAIYVVTASGDLVLSFNIRPHASLRTSAEGADDDGRTGTASIGFHHHSSLVGGAAVAAAGTMRIREGVVVAVDNASGHYRPPGSTLQLVMGRLEALGVGGLEQVEVIDITAAATTRRTPSATLSAPGTAHPMELTKSHTGLVQRPTVQRPAVAGDRED